MRREKIEEGVWDGEVELSSYWEGAVLRAVEEW